MFFNLNILNLFPPKQPQVDTTVNPPSLRVYIHTNHIIKAYISCLIETNTSILICDIVHKDYPLNHGAGSMMISHLLKFAESNGYKYIHGNLSVVDIDHKDKLHHFYKKHGFTVTVFDKPRGNHYGSIEKHINIMKRSHTE